MLPLAGLSLKRIACVRGMHTSAQRISQVARCISRDNGGSGFDGRPRSCSSDIACSGEPTSRNSSIAVGATLNDLLPMDQWLLALDHSAARLLRGPRALHLLLVHELLLLQHLCSLHLLLHVKVLNSRIAKNAAGLCVNRAHLRGHQRDGSHGQTEIPRDLDHDCGFFPSAAPCGSQSSAWREEQGHCRKSGSTRAKVPLKLLVCEVGAPYERSQGGQRLLSGRLCGSQPFPRG